MSWQATSLGDPNREVVTTPERLAWWETRLTEASRTGLLSWDTETSGLKWWAGSHHPKAMPHCLRSESPRIIGHCAGYWEGDRVHAAYFPIRHEGMERQLEPEKVTAMAKAVLSISSAQVVFHNAKFDLHFLRKDGVEVGAFVHDSMIMAALVDEHGKKSLEVLSEKYGVDCGGLDAKRIVQRSAAIAARRVGLRKKEWPGYALVPISVLGPYGAGDAESTLYLGTKLLGMVRDNWWGLYATEMVVLRRLFEAEETGMGVDVPVLQGIADQAEIDSEKAYGSLVQVAGVFNPSQDDAVRDRLFGYLKAPHTKFNKKTKVHKVDAKELSKLWHMHHDPRVKTFISSLLAWRKANKLKTTYSTSLIAMVDPNGRLHTDFRQCEAETGRMASANPNFQNFPNDGLIRSAFIVPEGWVRVYLDYSQVELRILAYCTGDPAMVRAFVAGEDLHSMTSMELFGSAEREFRKKAKTINFGLCIAEGQRVLTDTGLVPIEQVEDWHKVWDGVEWVSHDGLVCRGVCEVVTYDGVTATPEHGVFTEDGRRVPIGEESSALHPRRLAVGAAGEVPIGYSPAHWEDRAARKETLCGDHMLGLPAGSLGGGVEPKGRQIHELPVSAEVWGPSGADLGAALRCDDPALLSGHARLIEALQGEGDQGAVPIERALHPLGVGGVSGFGIQGPGLRSDRQRRALQSGESTVGVEVGEPTKRTAVVYDLLNAGPRHRFTVEGKIVSNSYGMTPLGFLLDMCLDLTRNPPTLAEAEEYFDAFHKKFPAMDRWARGLYRNMLQHQVPAARNIFGRTRRLPLLRASSNYERGRAERKAVSSAIQGTSADVIKHALGQDRFLEVLVQLGGKLVNIVHDEVQVDFPRENALEGATRLKVIMEDYPIFRPIPILADGQWSATNWKEKTQIWV